jgi:hypothetical protein
MPLNPADTIQYKNRTLTVFSQPADPQKQWASDPEDGTPKIILQQDPSEEYIVVVNVTKFSRTAGGFADPETAIDAGLGLLVDDLTSELARCVTLRDR